MASKHSFTHMRRDDWAIRFVEFIKDSQDLATDLAIDWEHVTCTSFAGDCVEALTGVNPYDDWKGRFKSIAQAVRAIKAEGFQNLDDLMVSLFPEIPVAFAQPGDLLLVPAARRRVDPEFFGPNNPLPSSDISIPENIFGLGEGELLVMPHGIAVADPPNFWIVSPEGLAKGPMSEAVKALAVGRVV